MIGKPFRQEEKKMTGDTPHMAEYLKFTFCFNADSKWNGAY
jgi:hypothetical protein